MVGFAIRPAAADDRVERFPALRAFQARVRAIEREVDVEREETSSVGSDDSDDDGEGGAAETAAEEKLRRCVVELGAAACLFRRERRPEDAHERKKFLKIVKKASRHLLQLYFEPPQADDAPPNLASHPSNGVKKLADSVNCLLGQHWKCRCHVRRPAAVREARLSLTRHRKFLLKAATPPRSAREENFEVLLPVCRQSVTWKVTDVQAMTRM